MSTATRRVMRSSVVGRAASTYAHDTFTRTNMAGLGVAESGQTWQILAGSWNVNAATAVPVIGADTIAVLDVGTGDIKVSASLRQVDNLCQSGVAARVVNMTTFYSLQVNHSSGDMFLLRRKAGSDTFLKMFTAAWTDGDSIALSVVDQTGVPYLTCYVNDIEIWSMWDFADAIPNTATRAGLISWSWGVSPIFDTLRITAGTLPQSATQARQALGYNGLILDDDFTSFATFDLTATGAPGYNWYLDHPFGRNTMPASDLAIANSVLTITQTETDANWGIATSSRTTGKGQAFRYGYYEATMRFDPSLYVNVNEPIAWPAFWSISTSYMQAIQPRYAELDFYEAVFGSGWSGYAGTVHDWVNVDNPGKTDYANYGNNVFNLPADIGYNSWHRYGCLWELGRIRWYLDDKLLITQLYSASTVPVPDNPGTPLPSGTFSSLDTETLGMTVVLGCAKNWPLEIDSVKVWGPPESHLTFS